MDKLVAVVVQVVNIKIQRDNPRVKPIAMPVIIFLRIKDHVRLALPASTKIKIVKLVAKVVAPDNTKDLTEENRVQLVKMDRILLVRPHFAQVVQSDITQTWRPQVAMVVQRASTKPEIVNPLAINVALGFTMT